MKTDYGITYALVLLVFVSVTNCRKPDATEIPACIQQKIDDTRAQSVRNPPASIWQYEYNGQLVFYIPAYCCDIPSQLFDNRCNLLCNPDGGFTGRGDGRCTDFSANRKNEKVIWQDARI